MIWHNRRWAEPSARQVDLLLAAGLAVMVTLASLTSDEPGAHPSVLASFALGAVLGGLVLRRRRWPVGVLVVSIVVLMAYHAANFPAIGQGWPLVVSLYTCATMGRLRAAVLIAGGSAAFGTAAWLIFDGDALLPVLAVGAREVAIMAVVLAFGDAVRSRRGWAAEAQERIRRLERERERETSRRVVEERVQIARELHDITAHTLAVAGVQLHVAADTLADSPEQARSALRAAQQANREAVAELKAAVRVLRQERDEQVPRSPTPGLDGVERLLDAAREAGLRVEYRQTGSGEPPPASAGLAVFRIVQESITNVLRHAAASTVQVDIGYQPDGLSVRVADDGRGTPAGPAPDGHGLIGMRERVFGLGGTFSAGRSELGFTVDAWIPLDTALVSTA